MTKTFIFLITFQYFFHSFFHPFFFSSIHSSFYLSYHHFIYTFSISSSFILLSSPFNIFSYHFFSTFLLIFLHSFSILIQLPFFSFLSFLHSSFVIPRKNQTEYSKGFMKDISHGTHYGEGKVCERTLEDSMWVFHLQNSLQHLKRLFLLLHHTQPSLLRTNSTPQTNQLATIFTTKRFASLTFC